MRDPKRIDKMLKIVEQLWKKYPDMRLGQLLDNARVMVSSKTDMFYIEDDKLEYGLEMFLKKV